MKVLVANRGEIACRVLRTLQEKGIPSVAIYSDVDAETPHVWLADEAVALGDPRAYLDIDAVLGAVKQTGATAVHPGYGFLAENPLFAEACSAAGIVFIGPSADAMRAFADKRAARELAVKHDVPVIPGAEQCDSVEGAKATADSIGYPVLLKAAAGGGGKGMRKVQSPEEMEGAFESATREATASFSDGRLLIEKYIYPARHIEVQILGDGKRAIAVGERECSLQRRYQKVLEEAPSVSISTEIREALFESATRLVEVAGYSGAGTVEFLVGPDGAHYFLEVNTRLQVEHPVTEMVTGLDLVNLQIEIAHGGELPEVPQVRGHALEARLNAEDAYNGYLPQSGPVLMLEWPQWPGVRVDSGIIGGGEVSTHYDSMIAKVIVWGEDREAARRKLATALRKTTLLGITTNQSFLIDVLERPFFSEAKTFTTTLEEETWSAPEVPDYVQELGESLAAGGGRSAAQSGNGKVDTFTPWEELGGFRMGR